MRLVTSKNSGLPSSTTQRASMPASQVAEQEGQHLGDPPALLGRIHVPQPPATQPIGRHLQATQEATAGVRIKHGLEPSRIQPGYLNVLQSHLSPSPSQAAER